MTAMKQSAERKPENPAEQKPEKKGPTRARRVARWLFLGAAALGVLVSVALLSAWRGFGKAPAGQRIERMEASAHFQDGVFVNENPMWVDMLGTMKQLFLSVPMMRPDAPLPVKQVSPEQFKTPPKTGLRVTWLGHSTLIIEIDGRRFLMDPIWGPTTSPVTWTGPERWYAPPIALTDLPSFDAVLLSHDHYDHLDAPTIEQIKDWDTRFIAPLGVGAHLAYWGVPEGRITELDWWDEVHLGDFTVTALPSRHASGRHVSDQYRTLWAGYALVGLQHRVYFSGDTGLFPGMKEIGERLGPFDLTMLEVGAYDQNWPDWHLGPEQAVLAHKLTRGKVLLPIHWGLFTLAKHSWTEPMERILSYAEKLNVRVATPVPGGSLEPEALEDQKPWWPRNVPFRSAEEYPVRASKNGDPKDLIPHKPLEQISPP